MVNSAPVVFTPAPAGGGSHFLANQPKSILEGYLKKVKQEGQEARQRGDLDALADANAESAALMRCLATRRDE